MKKRNRRRRTLTDKETFFWLFAFSSSKIIIILLTFFPMDPMVSTKKLVYPNKKKQRAPRPKKKNIHYGPMISNMMITPGWNKTKNQTHTHTLLKEEWLEYGMKSITLNKLFRSLRLIIGCKLCWKKNSQFEFSSKKKRKTKTKLLK